MARLSRKQLEDYLRFVDKCVERNFDIKPAEMKLLAEIQIVCAQDEVTKNLIDSLMYEQHSIGRQKKIEKYLNN